MPVPGAGDQTRLPDFEVAVAFLDAAEGGRKTPASQGYRPDMVFESDRHTWMIHPEFLREDGSSYSIGARVPRSTRANMYVFSTHVRQLLRNIVRVGEKVRMVEGSHAVALGEVTAVKNLPNELSEYEGAASAFALPAKAYVHWLERTADSEAKGASMAELHEILARLQIAAALLPAIGTTREESRSLHFTKAANLASSVAIKLPVKDYSFVFNPLDQNEWTPVRTTLANDLDDIYSNINDGLELYDAGSYQDALWKWHSLYYIHWGRHLSHAQ